MASRAIIGLITPYRMLGLGMYLVAVSQVLYLTTYNLWEYSVLNTMSRGPGRYWVILILRGSLMIFAFHR